MSENEGIWSSGTLRGTNDQIRKSMRTTISKLISPRTILPKTEVDKNAVVEKDMDGQEEIEGLGSVLGLGRFRDKNAKPDSFPGSSSAANTVDDGADELSKRGERDAQGRYAPLGEGVGEEGGQLRQPTGAERDHEMMRITNAREKAGKDDSKFASIMLRRMDAITHPQKMKNFGEALKGEGHHKLASEAKRRLLEMIRSGATRKDLDVAVANLLDSVEKRGERDERGRYAPLGEGVESGGSKGIGKFESKAEDARESARAADRVAGREMTEVAHRQAGEAHDRATNAFDALADRYKKQGDRFAARDARAKASEHSRRSWEHREAARSAQKTGGPKPGAELDIYGGGSQKSVREQYNMKLKPRLREVASKLGYAVGDFAATGRYRSSTRLYPKDSASPVDNLMLDWVPGGTVEARVRRKEDPKERERRNALLGLIGGSLIGPALIGMPDARGKSDPKAVTLHDKVKSAIDSALRDLSKKEKSAKSIDDSVSDLLRSVEVRKDGIDVEKILKEGGWDKLPLTDKGKEILADAIHKGAKPATMYTGKLMVDHGVPEEPPAFMAPKGLKVGDRVIPLQWTPMGVHGAQFDLFSVPGAAKVKKMYTGPVKVTKNSYPFGRIPADLSKVETTTEERLWGLELEAEGVQKEDDGCVACPMTTKDTTMVLRLEPLATPEGEVS